MEMNAEQKTEPKIKEKFNIIYYNLNLYARRRREFSSLRKLLLPPSHIQMFILLQLLCYGEMIFLVFSAVVVAGWLALAHL